MKWGTLQVSRVSIPKCMFTHVPVTLAAGSSLSTCMQQTQSSIHQTTQFQYNSTGSVSCIAGTSCKFSKSLQDHGHFQILEHCFSDSCTSLQPAK